MGKSRRRPYASILPMESDRVRQLTIASAYNRGIVDALSSFGHLTADQVEVHLSIAQGAVNQAERDLALLNYSYKQIKSSTTVHKQKEAENE